MDLPLTLFRFLSAYLGVSSRQYSPLPATKELEDPSSRVTSSRSARFPSLEHDSLRPLDDLCNAQTVISIDDHYLASSDHPLIQNEVDWVFYLAVQFHERPRIQLQNLTQPHTSLAETQSYCQRHINDTLQLGCHGRLFSVLGGGLGHAPFSDLEALNQLGVCQHMQNARRSASFH